MSFPPFEFWKRSHATRICDRETKYDLLVAIQRLDNSEVRDILRHVERPEVSAIHIACSFNNIEAVKLLLAKKGKDGSM
jgi:ankyrin repeat protein